MFFEQTPNSHLSKKGCMICSGVLKYNTESFINKCEMLFGKDINNAYDFSLVDYKNNKTNIKIICKKHGIFEQRPDMFLQKHGCDKCSGTYKYTTSEFIKKSKEIHGDKYDYSLVDYISALKKVKIICKKHGIFEQKPYCHLNSNGCPFCNISKGESRIKRFLEEKKINFKYQHKFKDCKYKSCLFFDFYLPNHNTCIEYDGIQHTQEIDYFGGKSEFDKQKIKDKIKDEYCLNNNIHLLRIDHLKMNEIQNILKRNFN